MEFKEIASIYIEERIVDGVGGYEIAEVFLTDIKVTVAPYRVESGMMYDIPNPLASVKFFTNSKLDFDEDTHFYIIYKGKKYKKVSFVNYGKCILIIGERV